MLINPHGSRKPCSWMSDSAGNTRSPHPPSGGDGRVSEGHRPNHSSSPEHGRKSIQQTGGEGQFEMDNSRNPISQRRHLGKLLVQGTRVMMSNLVDNFRFWILKFNLRSELQMRLRNFSECFFVCNNEDT